MNMPIFCIRRHTLTSPAITNMKQLFFTAAIALFLGACAKKGHKSTEMSTDIHTHAQPEKVVVTHLNLNLDVNFDAKVLSGYARWDIDNKSQSKEVIFDCNGLTIEKVLLNDASATTFAVTDSTEFMGAALKVAIEPSTKAVTIYYKTSPQAAALQWLNPQQTAGKKQPFLFTQSEAILARSWIPCQDSPGIRFTYEATMTVPKGMLALMSAENPTAINADGRYQFKQPKPIPAYLMALSVGDIVFKDLGGNTGVYAEPSMLEKCAYELVSMPNMLSAAEKLYGKYQWGRYDLIVLPPSFPFGGMENPMLTFATPTIIAGDRSLVNLVAHELAHSWSGNLVTNATWNDFWLNEGFTVYFERRIMEAIEGKEYADMLSVLGYNDLLATVEDMGATAPDTRLKLDLSGRNPDDGVSDIAYEKGFCLLRTMEEAVGRERFDAFLNGYFSSHAFKTITTEQFIEYYNTELIKGDKALADKIQIEKWIYEPGVPANCYHFTSVRFEKVDKAVADWKNGTAAAQLATKDWSTHEWLRFINNLPDSLSQAQMKGLDDAFGFTKTGNSEIADAWFIHAIRNQYTAAYPSMEEFLTSVGRRKFLTPLYREMVKSDAGKEMAKSIYAKARPNYHYVATQTMDGIVK